MSLPLIALEEMPDGSLAPVEAPPCGHPMEMPAGNVLFRCDKPAGHTGPKHRAVFSLDPQRIVEWAVY